MNADRTPTVSNIGGVEHVSLEFMAWSLDVDPAVLNAELEMQETAPAVEGESRTFTIPATWVAQGQMKMLRLGVTTSAQAVELFEQETQGGTR